jgi:uncharacterized membrane protein (UPF0127 family)
MKFFGNADKKNHKKNFSKSCLFFVALFFISAIGVELWQFHWSKVTVRLGGIDLYVLVANTPSRWHRGLGNRTSLAPYDGMIFLFPETKTHGFVMRDMHFPIDIIWLDHGVVVDIAPSVPVEPGASESELRVYYPRKPANIVLELNAGWADTHNLRIGDRMAVIDG